MNILELKKYEFNKELITRTLGDTIMVYNPQNGDMYEMNDITALLIEYLKKGLSGEEILKDICTQFDVDVYTVIDDVNPLFDRLVEINLLNIED